MRRSAFDRVRRGRGRKGGFGGSGICTHLRREPGGGLSHHPGGLQVRRAGEPADQREDRNPGQRRGHAGGRALGDRAASVRRRGLRPGVPVAPCGVRAQAERAADALPLYRAGAHVARPGGENRRRLYEFLRGFQPHSAVLVRRGGPEFL